MCSVQCSEVDTLHFKVTHTAVSRTPLATFLSCVTNNHDTACQKSREREGENNTLGVETLQTQNFPSIITRPLDVWIKKTRDERGFGGKSLNS